MEKYTNGGKNMTIIHEGMIMPEFIEESYDCSKIFDISDFFTPAECCTSEITYFKESSIRLERYEIKKEIREKDEEYEAFSYSELFDISDIKAAEIEIEDEIKMGYLWGKYSHSP